MIGSIAALSLVVLLQGYSPMVDDILAEMADGAGPPATLPEEVGVAAAERIEPMADDLALERLAAIARAGKALEALAARLLSVVAANADAAPTAVRLLGELPPVALPSTAPSPAVELLIELSLGDDEPLACSAAGLVGRWATPEVVVTILPEWRDRRFASRGRALLEQLAVNTIVSPVDWLTVLIAMPEDDASWGEGLGTFVRTMARRDLAAADLVLEQTEAGSQGPSASLIRGLGGVKLGDEPRRQRARATLLPYIEAIAVDADALHPVLLAALLRAGADLMLEELPPLLPDLALHGRGVAVRVASIEALRGLAYKDAPTIDLLIQLLDDEEPTVVVAAHEVLCLKTRLRMPGRKAVWERWRASTPLADEPPGGLPTWLAKRREVEASRRRGAPR